jgi:hypothetical protein
MLTWEECAICGPCSAIAGKCTASHPPFYDGEEPPWNTPEPVTLALLPDQAA